MYVLQHHEALKLILTTLQSTPVFGLKGNATDTVEFYNSWRQPVDAPLNTPVTHILPLKFERALGVSAKLNVYMMPKLQPELTFRVRTEILWDDDDRSRGNPTPRRSVAAAMAAISLYQDVVRLAYSIEAHFENVSAILP